LKLISAENKKEATDYILNILLEYDSKLVVLSKSMIMKRLNLIIELKL
jgi:L-lactate utilization protein LutB